MGWKISKRLQTALLLAAAAGALWLLREWDPSDHAVRAIVDRVRASVYIPVAARFKELVLDPVALAAIGLIILLQSLVPAKPAQRIFSASLAQDLAFVFLDAVTKVVVISAYVAFLRLFYERHL